MQRYYTLAELEEIKSKLKLNGALSLPSNTIENIIDQAIYDQTTLRRFIGFFELMIRQGSSWSDRIQDVLNEYLFDTANKEVINAAIALLAKHRSVSVDSLLTRLSQFDKRSLTTTNSNLRQK